MVAALLLSALYPAPILLAQKRTATEGGVRGARLQPAIYWRKEASRGPE